MIKPLEDNVHLDSEIHHIEKRSGVMGGGDGRSFADQIEEYERPVTWKEHRSDLQYQTHLKKQRIENFKSSTKEILAYSAAIATGILIGYEIYKLTN